MSLILLQVAYLVAAVMMLIASLCLKRLGRRPLTPVSPGRAMPVFAGYAIVLGLGAAGQTLLYRLAMIGFVLLIGWNGVIAHIFRRFPESAYAGHTARLAAIAINLYGLLLNVAAAALGPKG